MFTYDAREEAEMLSQVYDELKSVFAASNPLHALLVKRTLEYSDQLALTDGSASFSYADLLIRINKRACLLQRQGVKAGTRVLMWLPNSCLFYEWYHAIHEVGAIVVLVPSTLHEAEATRIFMQCQPSIVIAEASRAQAVLGAAGLSSSIFLDAAYDVNAEQFEDVQESDGRKLDDVAVILYTSGSTGDPRGVALSVRNILTNAAQSFVRMMTLGLNEQGERFLVVLPLAHAFAHMTCLWLPLIAAAQIYVLSVIKKYEIKNGFKNFAPTVFFLAPVLVGLLCSMPDICFDSVKVFISGGDFLPVRFAQAFEMLFGRRICSGYGLSEAGPVVGVNVDPRSTATSAITPFLQGIEYKIVQQKDELCEMGELWISGNNVFQGYFEGADVPLRSILVDGWLPTGDLVSLMPNGSVHMVGRCKEIIVFKGFNVYPQEIERVLLSHKDIQFAVVVGQEHETFGQIPVSWVTARPGMSVDIQDVVQHCKNHLASYKIPHKIIVVDQIPLNHLGKLDRKIVKKMMSI